MKANTLYAAVWRWHFYAGLMTLPFLISLSVTGGLYLFKDEINDRLYGSLLQVTARTSAPLSASGIVRQATAGGARPTGYVQPAAPDRAAQVIVENGTGESRDVFVDPYDGRVLGELARGTFGNLPLMNFVRRLHSLELAGWPGNRLIEIVAGWAIILAATGVYLWWPRRRGGGVFRIRRDAGRRAMWRDVHAVTGVVAAGLIAFMALTGLPWSGVWGEGLKSIIDRTGQGYPAGYWNPAAHSSTSLHHSGSPAPWTIADMPLPTSHDSGTPIGIDDAVSILRDAEMPRGYTLNYPVGAEGVWSASIIPDRVENTRVVHLDQYSGDVLFDARYADLGPAAQVIEWGISVHTGQQFGRVNQLLMLLVCLAILVMSVAAVMMWWARRPRGSLGAPRYAENHRMPRGYLLVIVVGGLVFPLVGASILAFLVIDAVLPARLRRIVG